MAEAVRRGHVLVVDASGNRALICPEVAAAMIRADRGARVVPRRGDGTLAGAPSRPDEVYLSGLFSSIASAVRSVTSRVAPVVGAAVGGITGGPAGAAAGYQVGSVVGSAVRNPTADERLQKRAAEMGQRAARLGVTISSEQALWLASQTDAKVNTWFGEAKRLQDKAQTEAFAASVAQASQAGYAPQTSAYLTPEQLAAQQAAYNSAAATVAPSAGGIGALLSNPVVLGAAALAAFVVLKK